MPPLDPSNPYLEVSHEKMTIGKDFRYGCYQTVLRNKSRTEQKAQVGWTVDGRRIITTVISPWKDIPCGHIERHSDAYCQGCSAMRKQPKQREKKE